MTKDLSRLCASVALGTTLLIAGAAGAAEHESTTGTGHEVGAAGAVVPGTGHGHHGPSFDAKTFGLQLVNFGLLGFVLVFFGGKAINKALLQRHETMKLDLAEASRLRAAAEVRLKEQERRLTNLEAELNTLRANLKHEAQAEKGRLIATAEEKSRRIQHETQFLLEQQVKDAELRFRAEVAASAARVAEEIVRRQVNAGDLQRLANSFAAEVDGGAQPPVTSAARNSVGVG